MVHDKENQRNTLHNFLKLFGVSPGVSSKGFEHLPSNTVFLEVSFDGSIARYG